MVDVGEHPEQDATAYSIVSQSKSPFLYLLKMQPVRSPHLFQKGGCLL